MKSVDEIIENKRKEIVSENNIIEEGKITYVLTSTFKDVSRLLKVFMIVILSPIIIGYALIIIIGGIMQVNDNINESMIQKILKNNPELVSSINKISNSIYNTLIKIYPKNKDYLKYIKTNSKNVYVKKKVTGDGSVIIYTNIATFNIDAIVKDATGYETADDYLNSLSSDQFADPESIEKYEENFKNILDTMVNSINIIDDEIHKKYSLFNVQLDHPIDYSWVGQGIYFDCNVELHIKVSKNKVDIPDDIKSKVNAMVNKLKPSIEKSLK